MPRFPRNYEWESYMFEEVFRDGLDWGIIIGIILGIILGLTLGWVFL